MILAHSQQGQLRCSLVTRCVLNVCKALASIPSKKDKEANNGIASSSPSHLLIYLILTTCFMDILHMGNLKQRSSLTHPGGTWARGRARI